MIVPPRPTLPNRWISWQCPMAKRAVGIEPERHWRVWMVSFGDGGEAWPRPLSQDVSWDQPTGGLPLD